MNRWKKNRQMKWRQRRTRMAQRDAFERWRAGVEGEAEAPKASLPVGADAKFAGMP
jgi:hypothetical protein